MSILARYQSRYESALEEELSIPEYLELCKQDPGAYASVAERMLTAIGEPELVDTRLNSRLSRLFANKIIKVYPAFREFYGMEEVIEHVVSYIRHAAQGLEEKKQILYLLGPVGGGKSSCNDPVKICSSVNLEGVEHDEHGHGRRNQAMDGQAQKRAGH